MKAAAPWLRWQREWRLRRILIVLALGWPPLLGLAACALRLGAATGALGIVAGALLASVLVALHCARRDERASLAHRLDALEPTLEDSAALLWRDEAGLTPLQALQRARLLQRVAALAPRLRPRWPRRALAASLLLAAVLFAFAASWRAPPGAPVAPDAQGRAAAGAATASRVVAASLAIEPPAYTGLPARNERALDARVVQDAAVHWRLRLAPLPQRVRLEFHDGSQLPLQREGEDWVGGRALALSSLYRIEVEGAPPLDDALHRIDVIADRAPTIRIVQPAHSLNQHDGHAASWPLEFEADDDYGIAAAELSITHAQGSGENVRFSERSIALTGSASGSQRSQHYRHALDLAGLGFSAGDELIARLIVRDNRTPTPNTTRSAGLILRWPLPRAAEGAGLDGITQQVLPAYFRSQRQIIIDTQALLAEQDRLTPERLLARSDGIGVDQKILRLRYGQFLGEEAEGAAHAAVEAGHAAQDSQLGALAAAHEAGPAHDEAADAFGQADDVSERFGHVHDIAEAATLLDPATRATLKAALDEMWQAELQLRQGAPAAALPYEERALVLIKQAQQATRIYLARVGLELPQADETRRLSGAREGVADVAGSLSGHDATAAPLVRLWQALDTGAPPDWDAALRDLRAAGPAGARTLDVLAALDRARREPDCAECRERLRAALWPLLPTPTAQVAPRAAADAAGAAYLQALPGSHGAPR